MKTEMINNMKISSINNCMPTYTFIVQITTTVVYMIVILE